MAFVEEVIGFIGLGNMGGPMCDHLIDAGCVVHVYDINRDAMDEAVTRGAVATESASACAAVADLLLTSLPRPDHVEDVMGGERGALQSLRQGCIWIDLTTNQIELLQDSTAHAEMLAITAAASTLGDWRLDDCDMYLSLIHI